MNILLDWFAAGHIKMSKYDNREKFSFPGNFFIQIRYSEHKNRYFLEKPRNLFFKEKNTIPYRQDTSFIKVQWPAAGIKNNK